MEGGRDLNEAIVKVHSDETSSKSGIRLQSSKDSVLNNGDGERAIGGIVKHTKTIHMMTTVANLHQQQHCAY